jgi:hypothetical protein
MTIKKLIKLNFRHFSFILVFPLLMNFNMGCSGNCKNEVNESGLKEIPESILHQNRVFLLVSDKDPLLYYAISMNDDHKGITGLIKPFPGQPCNHPEDISVNSSSYPDSRTNITQQVHIYVGEYLSPGEQKVSIPFSSIIKIEIYEKIEDSSEIDWHLSATYDFSSAPAYLNLIVSNEKSFCPFIYAHNGVKYVFSGEILSGATKPGLERHDYMYLPDIKPYNNQYLIKITNEVREIQYINLMKLRVIDHPADIKVLIDKYGRFQTISKPVLPKSAVTYSGRNILPGISSKGNYAYTFDNITKPGETTDGIKLSWDKPTNAIQVKLIIRARNSLWLDHVFSSFHQLFGSRYDYFSKLQEDKNAEYHRHWMIEQSLPLLVYLEINGEWELYDIFEIAGTMAMKDDVMQINVRNLKSETINIKLETGFKFWELDYVAVDFSRNIPLQTTTVSLNESFDENGLDVSLVLMKDDQSYYKQLEIGNEAILSFPVPEFTDGNRTIILESKGYYHILRNQQGLPRMKEILSFRQAGRMPLFSKELYEECNPGSKEK